jgi:hypothetical protein
MAPPTTKAPVPLDRQLGSGSRSLGRCIFCDERCNVDSDFHEHCRLESEIEEQQLAALQKRNISRIGWTD